MTPPRSTLNLADLITVQVHGSAELVCVDSSKRLIEVGIAVTSSSREPSKNFAMYSNPHAEAILVEVVNFFRMRRLLERITGVAEKGASGIAAVASTAVASTRTTADGFDCSHDIQDASSMSAMS